MKLNPKDLMKSVATRLDRHSGASPTGISDMACTRPPARLLKRRWVGAFNTLIHPRRQPPRPIRLASPRFVLVSRPRRHAEDGRLTCQGAGRWDSTGTGRRGEAKKQGGGGRGTWGTWQDELRAYADDSHEFFDEGDEDFDLVAYPSTPKEEEGVVAPPPSTVDVPTVKPEQLMMVLTEAYLKSHAYDPAPRRQMPSKSGPCRQALRNPHVRRTGALRQPRPTAQGCH